MDDQAAVVEALGVAIAARVLVLLWGAPGTGKTSVIRAMAAAAGWPCETVIASIREPSDFAGLPVVNHAAGGDGARVEFAPPRLAVSLADAGHGVVFFDEVSTAPPAVQAALLRVVPERTVGDLALPDATLRHLPMARTSGHRLPSFARKGSLAGRSSSRHFRMFGRGCPLRIV